MLNVSMVFESRKDLLLEPHDPNRAPEQGLMVIDLALELYRRAKAARDQRSGCQRCLSLVFVKAWFFEAFEKETPWWDVAFRF